VTSPDPPRASSSPESAPVACGARRDLLVSALAFGAGFPAFKWALGEHPLFGAGWLYLTAGLALTLWSRLGPRRPEPPLSRADLPWLLASIAAGGVIAPVAQVRGLSLLPAHVGALLSQVELVAAALLAVLFFGERLSPRRWLGVVVLLAAGLLCAGLLDAAATGTAPPLEGVLCVSLAGVAWGFDTNATRRIAHRDPAAIARAKGVVGGGAVVLFAVANDGWPSEGGARLFAGGALVGVVISGAALMLFIRSLRGIGAASATAVFVVVSTFVGVLGAAVFLDERVSFWVAPAAVLIVLGTGLVTSGPEPAPPGASPAARADPAAPVERPAGNEPSPLRSPPRAP
jgi:drug/metabolite transporter (DMT)-like permease